MQIAPTRRRFLTGLSAASFVGAAGLPLPVQAEPVPETTTVRLPRWFDGGAYCWTANYLAGELLRAEGFTVQYVEGDPNLDNSLWLAHGEVDFDFNMPSMQILLIDRGTPLKILTGLHTGCFEMIASAGIHDLMDLRGKKVGVDVWESHPHILMMLMISYIGLDPKRDVQWVTTSGTSPADVFMEGKIDAFIAGPPFTQELRARKIGHTILNNAVDRPWSQYFCCMLAGSADYVSKYPIATKRVVRAMLKGADLCASDPASVARRLVNGGYLAKYEYALQTLKDVRYDTWRDYDASDSVRFYALRMQETGLIKSNPQKILADGTDWRFLDELKRELKT